MQDVRIGQLLRRIVPLSEQQVEEILIEQRWGLHRFGDTALALGYCRADHLVAAWCRQMADGPGPVDLARVTPEPEALACLPMHLARRYRVLPLRIAHTLLLLAADRELEHDELIELAYLTGRQVRVLEVDARALEAAFDRRLSQAQTARAA